MHSTAIGPAKSDHADIKRLWWRHQELCTPREEHQLMVMLLLVPRRAGRVELLVLVALVALVVQLRNCWSLLQSRGPHCCRSYTTSVRDLYPRRGCGGAMTIGMIMRLIG